MDSRYTYDDMMLLLRYLEKNSGGGNVAIKIDDKKNLHIYTKNNRQEDVTITLYKINGDAAGRMATITEENWLKSRV